MPGIVTELDHIRNPRTDNFSNEFDWFNMNPIGGWPSAHTVNSFAATTTISEIYYENNVSFYFYPNNIGIIIKL